MIELILLERVEKLGQMGQLVKVKPGFARNYLLPQKKAHARDKGEPGLFRDPARPARSQQPAAQRPKRRKSAARSKV